MSLWFRSIWAKDIINFESILENKLGLFKWIKLLKK